jgi:hypothetical protein
MTGGVGVVFSRTLAEQRSARTPFRSPEVGAYRVAILLNARATNALVG